MNFYISNLKFGSKYKKMDVQLLLNFQILQKAYQLEFACLALSNGVQCIFLAQWVLLCITTCNYLNNNPI